MLTQRDQQIVKEAVLDHCFYMEQLIRLKYFGSKTRANTRVRYLCSLGLLRKIETPYFSQALYCATAKAAEIVGGRIAPLVASRIESPRFLRHCLASTNARIVLLEKGAERWLFAEQIAISFKFAGRSFEVRPDGMVIQGGSPIAVEVDMGHCSARSFKQKLEGYESLVASGDAERQWRTKTVNVLTLTTSAARAKRLAALLPESRITHVVKTFAELSIDVPGAWS